MVSRVLIVDDDSHIREMLVRMLAPEGYNLSTAVNGLEALQRVAMLPPDLILLDVRMSPGPDGYQVCQQIKTDVQTASILVTFLTAQDDMGDRKRGIEVGANDYLTKPVNEKLLREHVRSQLRLKHLADQLEPAESVFFRLAQNVEARDHYTTGHLRRLEDYSEQLAAAAGLSSTDIIAVRYGSILHDIGKIRIREALLTKPGALTPDEFAHLKEHSQHGAQLISYMRLAARVVPIVLGHHEKWNGRGYPQGLHGDEIPVGARIVSIVDAYDAMTTDRPYRRALSQQEALRRLRSGSGTQWDPELIALFHSLVEHDRLTLSPRRLRDGKLPDGSDGKDHR